MHIVARNTRTVVASHLLSVGQNGYAVRIVDYLKTKIWIKQLSITDVSLGLEIPVARVVA